MKRRAKSLLQHLLRRFDIEITRNRSKTYEKRVVTLTSKNGNKANVLLSFIIQPFLSEDCEEPSNPSHHWECLQIAQSFLDLGYSVDVINYRNTHFVPQKRYSFFLDIDMNLERIAPGINRDCVKILYPVMAHWVSNNYASYKRSLELQKRRGVALEGRMVSRNQSSEQADYFIIKANEYTVNTYRYVNKPLYQVPHLSPSVYAWPEEKDFDACRRDFLWLSGAGFVHKGLDLALEAFVEMPAFHLYVCGRLEKEMDLPFQKVYFKELFQTPNIHTIGSVDVESPEFIQLANRCLAHLHLSCSECGGVSVLTCMHAGLIPIISYESSVDIGDFGIVLKDCSLNAVKQTVQTVSDLGPEQLKHMARRTWEYARAHHTYDRYKESLKKVIGAIVERHRGEN